MATPLKSLGSIRRNFDPWNDPTAKPLIEFDRVVRTFGDFNAVDDLSLDVYTREFFALLGPSGCGKSTLLRMLAGFERPTEGRIFLDGQDITDLPPYERPINMMFQSYALFPHMTVLENVMVGRHVRTHSGLLGAVLVGLALVRAREAVKPWRHSDPAAADSQPGPLA